MCRITFFGFNSNYVYALLTIMYLIIIAISMLCLNLNKRNNWYLDQHHHTSMIQPIILQAIYGVN